MPPIHFGRSTEVSSLRRSSCRSSIANGAVPFPHGFSEQHKTQYGSNATAGPSASTCSLHGLSFSESRERKVCSAYLIGYRYVRERRALHASGAASKRALKLSHAQCAIPSTAAVAGKPCSVYPNSYWVVIVPDNPNLMFLADRGCCLWASSCL
jgi:hypothetical protein